MQATIQNAAPMYFSRGTQDLSKRKLTPVALAIPQHCPLTFIYAKSGPTSRQLVVGDSMIQTYGQDTFDYTKQYANHSTVFANAFNANANAQVIERIRPDDAGPEANMLLSLDVIAKPITIYNRNPDGTFQLDGSGNKVATVGATPVAGFSVKWVVSSVTDISTFGAASQTPGDQTGPGSTQSTRYPILQFKASSFGSDGNNGGIRIWSPTVNSNNAVNANVLAKTSAYPFKLSVVRRPDATSTPVVVENLFSEQTITFTLKPGSVDPVTNQLLYLGDNFTPSYTNNEPGYNPVYGDFNNLVVYDSNIKTLVDMFYAAEKLVGYSSNDFTGAAGESYLFNFIGGTSSNGAPYNSFSFAGGTGAISLSELSNVFAASGSDGTMNDANFANSVIARMADYADENSQVQDTAGNIESVLYDSGFPLAAKYALCKFIAVRKDTAVWLSTFDASQPDLIASEESSLGLILRTRLQNYPESDYFGTPVMRGMIMGRSGSLLNSTYRKRVPALLEVAINSAKFMGASDGKWVPSASFDRAPGSILKNIVDLNVTFTSARVRNKDWDSGLNWVQRYDIMSNFFPALKTVYADDTSVLNSYFTVMAICQINKVTQSVWREFSGSSDLTNAQLVERVNAAVNKKLLDRFAGKYVIVPDAYFTDDDLQRGYSWTVPVKIYAPNMKTVMTTSVTSYRIGDLAAA